MAEPPKILQVTYGAFSCTLEGFEDPVEALIAVTEYFRGLGADDPLAAGAAPPPESAELRRRVAEAQADGATEVRIDLGTPGGAGPGGTAGERATAMGAVASSDPSAAENLADLPASDGAGARPGGEADWAVRDAAPGPVRAATGAPSPRRRRTLALPPDQDEAALLRLLSRTEAKLADPEAQRRREAMAHLKAAAAATQAERALEGELPVEEMAQPAAAGDAAASGDGSAPLTLAAAQRVDLPRMRAALSGPRLRPPSADEPDDGSSRAAGRPQTDAAAAPDAASTSPIAPSPEGDPGGRALEALRVGAEAGEGFAAFAASAGATALPDLLEAAAAWLSRQGEAEPSTRGELVALATEALRAEPVREDALRAIGTLLREGRLLRGQGGRLQAGTATRFDPGRPAG